MKSSIINKTTAIVTGALIALTPTMAFAEQPSEVAVPTLINYTPNQSLTKTIVLDGVSTDVQVYTIGGTKYIGVRDFADLYGYTVKYSREDNAVSISGNKPGNVYVTKIGSDTVYCNGKAYTISPEPVVVDQRLLMPLDELVKFTNDTYTEDASTISLTTKKEETVTTSNVPNQSLTKEIVQNGVPTDAQVYTISGTQYMKVSDFADLYGYVTEYNKDDNTLSVSGTKPGSLYVTEVGSDTVYCNGKAYTISPEPVVVDDELLMPLDQLLQFTGDTSMENANTVSLYTKNSVVVDGANLGTISTNGTFENDYDNGAKDTVTYNVQAPELSGMKDEAFQATLNRTFSNYVTATQEEAKQMFDGITKDDTFNYNGEIDINYTVNNYEDGILSITVNKYVFANGANGQTYAETFNIDLNNSKVLSYSDIFTVDNYEEILVNTINDMIESNPATYEGVEKVTKLDDNNFYLQDGNIVIYYMPYEISYGARGTVTFSINTNSLSDYMVSDYVGL